MNRPSSAPCPPASVRNNIHNSKLATCQDICFRVGRWFPVVFISVIIAWSYYAYTVNLCLGFINSTVTIIFYLIFYHVIFILLVFVYYKVTFIEPAGVPDEFYPPDDVIISYYSEVNIHKRRKVLSDFARSLPVTQRNIDGSIRFCDKCQCCKPDRTHHCGVIGKCVLKMDHFCPWINNTVGYSNYKLFILFLFYSIVYCLYVSLTSAPFFVEIWTDRHYGLDDSDTDDSDNATLTDDNFTPLGDDVSSLVKFNVLFVFFVALMFSLSVFVLFFYHVYLTLTNQSTIESFHPPYFQNGPDRRGYRVSCAENWRQVFGNDPKLWLLPILTSTVDGITFPCRFRAQPSGTDLESGQSAVSVRIPSNELLMNGGQGPLVSLADAGTTTPIASNGSSGTNYGSSSHD